MYTVKTNGAHLFPEHDDSPMDSLFDSGLQASLPGASTYRLDLNLRPVDMPILDLRLLSLSIIGMVLNNSVGTMFHLEYS